MNLYVTDNKHPDGYFVTDKELFDNDKFIRTKDQNDACDLLSALHEHGYTWQNKTSTIEFQPYAQGCFYALDTNRKTVVYVPPLNKSTSWYVTFAKPNNAFQ